MIASSASVLTIPVGLLPRPFTNVPLLDIWPENLKKQEIAVAKLESQKHHLEEELAKTKNEIDI